MSASLKTYQKYKDSGVEWLHDIPIDWAVLPFKKIFKVSNERVEDAPSLDLALSISGFRGVEPRDVDTMQGQMPSENIDKYRIVRKGQLAVNTMWLNFTGLGVSGYDGYISPAYRAYNIDHILDKKFANHLLRSLRYVQKYSSLLYGLRPNSLQVKNDDFEKIEIIVPPLETQKRIAAFLDERTKAIDELVAGKEKLIGLLREKRVSLITHIITKGLDPAVNMKNSGLEWVGQMPENWKIKKVKEIFNIHRGRVIAKTEMDDDYKYPVYSSQTENNGILGMINTYDYDDELLTWTTDGAKAGTVFKRVGKFSCTNVCGMLVLKNKTDNLNYLFYSVQHSATENKRPDTNGAKIMSGEMRVLKIVYAPLEIQKQIADYLDIETTKMDKAIAFIESQIEQLKEYRSSLTYSAVTGKIKI